MPLNTKEIESIHREIERLENLALTKAEISIQKGLKAIADAMAERSALFQTSGSDRRLSLNKDNLEIAQRFLLGLGPALQSIANEAKSQILSEIPPITAKLNEMLVVSGFSSQAGGAQIDEIVLGSFLDLDLSKFNGGATATNQVLSDVIFRSLSGNLTPTEFLNEIRATVEGQEDRAGNPMARHAKTWATTALNSFQGNYMQQAVPEELVGGWYYSGVRDLRNRPFCARRQGRFFTPEQIRADVSLNPIGASSLNNPGGWNCRHILIPVIPEDTPEDTGAQTIAETRAETEEIEEKTGETVQQAQDRSS